MHDTLHSRPRKPVRPSQGQRRANYLGSGLLLGSETNKVLTHSKIPVLVYR